MSAYLVSSDLIDLLVTAGLKRVNPHGCRIYYGSPSHVAELRRDTADEFGRMLWNENYRSVNHRYPDTIMEPGNMPSSGSTDVAAYTFQPVGRTSMLTGIPSQDPVPAGVLVNAIRCYEYQSCEHPGWADSAAHRYCSWLRAHLLNELARADGSDGWGWTRP